MATTETYQAWNGKSKRWVKYEFGKHGFKVVDVKTTNPTKAFKGVKKRGNRK